MKSNATRLVAASLGVLWPLTALGMRTSQAQTARTSLTGVWAAQRDYTPARAGGVRDGFRIQPAGGSLTYRFAVPARFKRLRDIQHVLLVVRSAPDGSLEAAFRNPEQNIGAAIGTRTLIVDGTTIHLRRANRPELTGTVRGATLRFHFNDFPGEYVFRRAGSRDLQSYYPRVGATRYTYRVPAVLGDGWSTGMLRSVGLDPHPLFDLMNAIVNPDAVQFKPYIQSVSIARHGRLVLDEYFYGFDPERPHDMRSAGKSVTTLLVGRAIEDGAPYRAATLVREVFAHYAPFAHDDARKDRMTVGDLMAMNSGLACDDNDDASPGNEATMQSQTGQPDWYKFTLDLPMAYEPGAHPSYCTAGINLLGGVIARGVHRWLPIYFDERFAQPMQFKQYGMWLMPPPLSDAYMGGGDYFRPRDFLKFGQLFLNHGTWHGRHVISDAWLHKISTKHATIEGEIGDYGYGWHIISYRFRGRTIHAINAGGNGGQLLFVFPQFDMAVMITAGNYGQYPVWSKFITQLVPRYILPAVIDVRRCCPKGSKAAGRRSSRRR